MHTGPNISKDGLVLHLDATNTRSYDASQNLLLYSSQIGTQLGTMYRITGTPIITLNNTIAPDGSLTGTTIDGNGNSLSNYLYSQNTTLTINTVYNYSIYVKQGTNSSFALSIDEKSFGGKRYMIAYTYSSKAVVLSISGAANDGEVLGGEVTPDYNGWFRVSIAFRTSSTNVSTLVDMISRYSAGNGVDQVWGRQLTHGISIRKYNATSNTAIAGSTTWFDLSGKNTHATIYNSPGVSNGAIQFRSVSKQYAISTFNEGVLKPSNLSGNWTLESVFRNISAPSSSESFIIGRAGCHGGIYCYISGVNSVLYHAIKTSSCWTGAANTIIATLVPGQYVHTVMTYSNGVIQSYINGVYVSTTIYDYTTYGMAGYSDLMYIGGNVSGNFCTNTDISIIKAYNIALTATEVQQNYNATKSRYGL
jgi:hypothetical protein